MIKRSLQKKIEDNLYKGKVIVLYGARRTGKTTLSEQILDNQQKRLGGKKVRYINCELMSAKESLETTNEQLLKTYLGDNDLIVLDEAQNIEKIGHVLKILVDTYPEMQIIATGSSSFDLANQIGEPLVGRKKEYILYPFSVNELKEQEDFHVLSSKLEYLLRFGSYPSIYNLNETEAQQELEEIVSSYLYKDILAFDGLKHSKILLNLLKLLALQLGNEVSFHEIAQRLEVSSATIRKYIDLLEKCFIIIPLGAFSRNLRNEIGNTQKIYFYDLGIRNAILGNHNTLDVRNDVGGLWENFCILERIKYNQLHTRLVNKYFWRIYSGQEVDYIEEHSGQLDGFEFKYSPNAKFKKPIKFLEAYENSSVQVVHKENWFEFLL